MSTPTPRTDANSFFADVKVGKTLECVTADFARTLERDLAAARAEVAALRESLSEAIDQRAKTKEWRTDHPDTTGSPERWVRDELCTKWRAAIDARKAQP